MPETNKLKKIIEYAVEKGWKRNWGKQFESDSFFDKMRYEGNYEGVLFNKNFAKAVFGFEQMLDVKGLCIHCGGEIKLANPSGFCNHVHYPEGCDICLAKTQDWKYHIQQAVISEDRIEYYYKYVENKQRGKEAK